MPKFFNADVADLAHQLTLSPRRLRMDQIRGTELLLELVEEDRAYPFEFVCFHITGYHKRRGSTSASIPGKALISDLVTLAEYVSRQANLSIAELDEPFRSHQDLATDLNVSTKTIRRWRHRGLLGIRVMYEDGVNRLAFCKSTVDRFVIKHGDVVARGAAFKQLSGAERRQITDRAAQLLGRRPLKLHAVAKIIAGETGRAVETVRYTLRRHEEAQGGCLFGRDGQGAHWERYQAIFRCIEAGEPVDAVARTFESDAEDIHRIVRHVRITQWQRADLDYIANELFSAPNADDLILGILEPVTEPVAAVRIPRDTPAYLQSLYQTPLLTREQEADLFRRYNYLKFRVARELEGVHPDEVTAEQFAAIEVTMKRIEEFKKRIIRANLRLVVSIAKKHTGASVNFFEVVSDGNVSLMRAVEKFDCSRGVKFSTYATWAIVKNYARSIPEQFYRSARYVTGQDELLHAAPGRIEKTVDESDRAHVREQIAEGMQQLSEREREIVSAHFGLGRKDGSLTLKQLGERFGVTKERIRQIELRALARLKDVLMPGLADAIAD